MRGWKTVPECRREKGRVRWRRGSARWRSDPRHPAGEGLHGRECGLPDIDWRSRPGGVELLREFRRELSGRVTYQRPPKAGTGEVYRNTMRFLDPFATTKLTGCSISQVGRHRL